jgi:hypothetical protein
MMKKNLVFTLLLAGIIGIFFIGCENPNGGGQEEEPVSIANSTWSDDPIIPETTLQFSAATVILSGQPSESTGNKNWYWGDMDGRNYPFDLVENPGDILALLDQVEDNWGTNYNPLPDAVIVVWTDPGKNIGFQLHYYAKGTGKDYERLICWGVGQPHEFKRSS